MNRKHFITKIFIAVFGVFLAYFPIGNFKKELENKIEIKTSSPEPVDMSYAELGKRLLAIEKEYHGEYNRKNVA